MRKCLFRIWTVVGGLLMTTAVSAQKNLSDFSIADDCTPKAVVSRPASHPSSTKTISPFSNCHSYMVQKKSFSRPTGPMC